MRPVTSAWVLTDGKAGDEGPCLALGEALGLSPDIRRVAPKAPFAWLAPFGPVDPREAPERPGSPLSPPWPDLAIASGRRAVPYLRHTKAGSRGRTFAVFLKDPRTGLGTADLIWVPAHDSLRGPNVIATATPPHRITPARLAQARAGPDPRLAALPSPRAALLVGGPSRHHRFMADDSERLMRGLRKLAASGVSLMATTSRRTPPDLRGALADLIRSTGGFLWDGTGPNPYLDLIALADTLVATADSYNMIGEAAASGVPILVFEPSGGHPKLTAFLDGLAAHGAVHPFRGRLEGGRYEPLNATHEIARAVAEGFARHRHALGLPDAPLRPE